MSDITLRGFNRKTEQAAALGISIRMLNKLMQKRAIPFYKVGKLVLFKPSEVEAAMRKFRVNEVGGAS